MGKHKGANVWSTVVSIVLHSFLNFKLINNRIDKRQPVSQDAAPPQIQFQAFNGQIYGIEVLDEGMSTKDATVSKQMSIVDLAQAGALSYDPYRIFEDQIFQRTYIRTAASEEGQGDAADSQ